MDLRFGSVLLGIKHAVPTMRAQQRGRIINNPSVNGIRVSSGSWLYRAAKAIKHARDEDRRHPPGPGGLTVRAVSPGAVATPIFCGDSASACRLAPEHEKPRFRKLTPNLGLATPVGKAGMPIDVAEAIVYLASDEARYINAQDLGVDGGMVARGTW